MSLENSLVKPCVQSLYNNLLIDFVFKNMVDSDKAEFSQGCGKR